MTSLTKGISLLLILTCCSAGTLHGQDFIGPDTLAVQSGNLTLTGLLWRPRGPGPFPAMIFSHGNYASKSSPGTVDALLGPVTCASLLAPAFTKNGYVFFVLFRRGTGLSKGEGESSLDRLLRAQKDTTMEERNKLQVRLLETEQLQDMISGLHVLRTRRDVDTNHIAVLGHSFGGSLALILAEHEPGLKAMIVFGAAAKSWNLSPQLRSRLTEAVTHISAPVLFIHAGNDYSTAPADSLGAVMACLNKPHSVLIYPSFGNNTDAGHNFVFLGITIWESDVLRFLDKCLRH